jgi:hypothetical protein
LKPRRVALVFDTSARMKAGDRLAESRREAAALPLAGDEVTVYARRARAPPRDAGTGRADRRARRAEPLLAAARAAADHVVLFSDRPVDGANLRLRAAPADNVGIVEFSATDDEVFVRIVNHGPAKAIPVELTAGAQKIRETIPAGKQVWSRRGDYSKVDSVRVTLDVADSFPLDNVVEATRLAEPGTTVSVAGLMEPQLVKALRSIPGVTLLTGTTAAKVAIGVDAAPGPGELRVWLISPGSTLSGEAVVATHALTADLEKRGSELPLGELPPGEQGGIPLIKVAGKVAAALRGKELRVCVDVHAWGKGLPSLPIFFANVVDYARAGTSRFAILRTGRPLLLPSGTALRRSPEGGAATLTPDGALLAYAVGDYGLETPGGPRTLRANLLDERESDTAGQSRGLSWNPGRPEGRIPKRKSYGGLAAGAIAGIPPACLDYANAHGVGYNLGATMSNFTILAIDDSKKILDIIKYFLENEGYAVKAVGDPFEGIQVAQQGGIDLILLDIMMPGMDGYTVFDNLKKDDRTREVPVSC